MLYIYDGYKYLSAEIPLKQLKHKTTQQNEVHTSPPRRRYPCHAGLLQRPPRRYSQHSDLRIGSQGDSEGQQVKKFTGPGLKPWAGSFIV